MFIERASVLTFCWFTRLLNFFVFFPSISDAECVCSSYLNSGDLVESLFLELLFILATYSADEELPIPFIAPSGIMRYLSVSMFAARSAKLVPASEKYILLMDLKQP